MALVALTLPPGMFRNGTDYQSRGRFYSGSLVRWHQGHLQPIGGWVNREGPSGDIQLPIADPTIETVRDIYALRQNDGGVRTFFGSNLGLYAMTAAGGVTDITPTPFNTDINVPVLKLGYGTGPYGAGPYGVARNPSAVQADAVSRWHWGSFGEWLIATTTNNNKIYRFAPGDATLVELANAPENVANLTVTQSRQIMVIKNDTMDIRQVIWSDVENPEVWASTPTNEAGFQRLEGSGNLIGLYRVQNQILILSETDAHLATYVGPPFVWSFERVGVNCGPANAKSVIATDRFVMWWGNDQFWLFDGSLRSVPCDVLDYLNVDLNVTRTSLIHSTAIHSFSELWWFYQSANSELADDVDSYVVYNYLDGHWFYGKLARTASIDQGILVFPTMVDKDGFVFNHEQRFVKVDGRSFVRTGPLELSQGQVNAAVRYVFVDSIEEGDLSFTFFTRNQPTDTLVSHGPYIYDAPLSPHGVMGREIWMEMEGLTNAWRIGTMRADFQNTGGGFR